VQNLAWLKWSIGLWDRLKQLLNACDAWKRQVDGMKSLDPPPFERVCPACVQLSVRGLDKSIMKVYVDVASVTHLLDTGGCHGVCDREDDLELSSELVDAGMTPVSPPDLPEGKAEKSPSLSEEE